MNWFEEYRKAVVECYRTPVEPSEEATDSNPMTPEEFATKMRESYEILYVKEDDKEVVHIAMDGIMCNLLRQLGYGEGVDVFNNTPKWYS